MNKTRISRKIMSIVLSVLMVAGMLPMAAFVSTAATSRAYARGEWNYGSSQINSARTGFDSNGPFYISMAIADTEFAFMQVEDNQEFTYTTHFYCKKNQVVNTVNMHTVETNVERDRTFANMITSTSWAQTGGTTENGTDDSPNGDGLVRDHWYSTSPSFITYEYTVNFTGNGSAVYNPEWQIEFESKGSAESMTTYNTAYTVLEGADEAVNVNPVFTIRVIDMRELRTLVNMANEAEIAINDITGGRDLSGETYYDQETVDAMVSALRERLLCDYSALDAQFTRAGTVEDNIVGALGGALYGDAEYAAYTEALADAKAVDRYLTEDAEGNNQALINEKAAALSAAIDNLLPTRKALINYYSGGELFAQNTCELGKEYNFHDVTDKFIGTPEMERMVFSRWVDADGNVIKDSTLITGDVNAYADFEVRMEGVSPLSSSGKWEHKLSEDNDDGRGDNYISMWVQDTTFNFVQTKDNETFSFYTDLTAYKNDGGNTCRVNDVYLLPNDAATQEFISAIGSHDIDYYCVTKNSDEKPTNSGLPGSLGSGYSYQSTIYRVIWRYIYTFDANGAATYNPKWNIEYTSGLWALSAGDHDLPDGGDDYVNFTINVTDLRELINEINKAESIYNNPNSYLQFTQDDLDALRSILDFIADNYTLDGSVYYEQNVIDGLVQQIKQVIPDGTQVYCDYTELDAAIALADEKRAEYNDNADNHYINEVWTNFMNAYNAATSVDRNLYIVESNVNQTTIDALTEDLNEAISALNYQTHVNQPCNYDAADDILDTANDINNDNGKYDDDAYQAFEDAKQDLEDLLNLYDDEDGNNQQAIDDAVQALQDAIDALNDAANQNDPCDYTALNEAIAAADAIAENDNFTPETYQALQDALEAAKAIPDGLYNDDAGNNQKAIDDAAQALNDAIDSLLQDIIDKAQNGTDTEGMTPISSANLDDAIAAAQDVQNDPDATAQDKVDAINALTDAIDSLTPDKDALEEAIAGAETVDSKLTVPPYSQEAVDALEDAVNGGHDVDNDPDATVQEIKDATDAIDDAVETILNETKDIADNTDTDGMTPDSVQNLEDAISNAEDVINNPDSTPEEKMDAINDVIDAINNLTPDKTELEETINLAEAIDTTNIDPTLVQELDEALADAHSVDDDADATVQEIRDATDALKAAIDDILQNVIDTANNTDTEGMTPVSSANLEDAIAQAEAVLNDPDATTQEKVDAINALTDAIDSLTPDKDALEEAITAAESIDTTDLPQGLVDALNDAVGGGQDVDSDPDATVPEIKAATDAINDAIDDILQQIIDEAQQILDNPDGYDPQTIQDLQDAVDTANNLLNDPDATAQDKVDAINDIKDAVGNVAVDKQALEDAIIMAQNEGNDPKYVQDDNMDNLWDEISNAQSVLNDDTATAQDVADAITALEHAIGHLLTKTDVNVIVYDTEGNEITSFVIPYGSGETTFGDIESQLPSDVSGYLGEDEVFLGWADETGDIYDDPSFILPENCEIHIKTQKTVIETTDTADIAVNRGTAGETEYTYMVGLNPAGTTADGILSQLKNDDTTIVITRGETELAGTDLVGTGCLVKCVNALDHSIVYEVATVILYGDVNGDGLVNADDKALVNADAFFGESNIEAGSVYFIAADVEKDGTLDAFDYFYVDGIMTGGRAFDQTSELYK